MVKLSPPLSKIVRMAPSKKLRIVLIYNFEYRATSAGLGTVDGLFPRLAFLDKARQVLGPHNAFIEAFETAHEADEDSYLIAISNQAATDV